MLDSLNCYSNLTKKLSYTVDDGNVTLETSVYNTQAIIASRHSDGRQMQFIMNYSTMKAFVAVFDGSNWVTHDLW